jgi:hypothetical protein
VHQLHGVIKLPIDRIEAILDAMSRARWVGRVGRGWALIKDAAEVSVAEIYHLFVFRTGARVAARKSGQDLDQLALELAGGIDDGLQLSLEELFLKAAPAETTVSPMRAQVV